MAEAEADHKLQGHWLLASLGKRVLRPGGLGLTRRLLSAAALGGNDRIVEFGPGVGKTATLLLEAHPASYVGVDPNPEGRRQLEAVLAWHSNAQIVVADAAETGLPDGSADLVLGEAMLTMCGPEDKAAIVGEAARILAPGGRYAIHELALTDTAPDPEPSTDRGETGRAISREIKVGARPLKIQAWKKLLENAGLTVEWSGTAPMHLLEPSRLVADEGIRGAARFAWRLMHRPEARKRVFAMRRSFRAHGDDLIAVAIVARKVQVKAEAGDTAGDAAAARRE
ncbi:class I SAM-dependent methyltransferase [Actinobaculum sp. 352]|uniref:class I SAM-dependent methyltransferase n=1 Tax=Actinobaculum sp. 352 TaxID=2490946 RepID=UPI0019D1F5C3|nr:class I SAM-dependent methyltransferase [Actinobaculum sp. 352]